jgi:hypothetical protein
MVHHEKLEERRKKRGIKLGTLTAGHKKDIVLSTRLIEHPDRVAIDGWHKKEGDPIQPLSTLHSRRYADYSHGVRLIAEHMSIGDEIHRLSEVLADRHLCHLVSDEGPNAMTSYPTTLPDYVAPKGGKKKKKKRRAA